MGPVGGLCPEAAPGPSRDGRNNRSFLRGPLKSRPDKGGLCCPDVLFMAGLGAQTSPAYPAALCAPCLRSRERQSGNGRAGPEPPRRGWGNCCGTSAAAAPPPQAQDRLVRPQDLQSFRSFSAWWHLSIWGSGQAHSVRTRDSACSQQRGKGHCKQSNSGRASLSPRRSFLIEYQTHPDLPSTLHFRGVCLLEGRGFAPLAGAGTQHESSWKGTSRGK